MPRVAIFSLPPLKPMRRIYLSYLDFDGDGVINGLDFGQFRTRFGMMLP
jgi:hypothetical protein